MRNLLLKGALCLFFITGPLAVFSQCIVVPLTLEKRAAAARSIVVGKVASKQSYLHPSGHVYTLNRVLVEAWLKNGSSASEVYVITLGGVYGKKATRVYPAAQLELNEDYLLFLENDNRSADNKAIRAQKPRAVQASLYGDLQGALVNRNNRYADPASGAAIGETGLFAKVQAVTGTPARTPAGRSFAPRAERTATSGTRTQAASITSFSPATTHAGTINTADFLTINGTGFGASAGTITFANADNGGSGTVAPPVASDIVSWTDTRIVVKVPSKAGSGTFYVNGVASPSPLTVEYSLLEINDDFFGFAAPTRQMPHLLDVNGQGGYTFRYHTNFAANGSAVTAFERSLLGWRCNTGINYNSEPTPVATGADGNDGQNTVLFEPGLPAGTLGRAITSYAAEYVPGACERENTIWWVYDIDIEFNTVPASGATWEFTTAAPSANEYDFESVALHEIGHATGMGHRIAPGGVMHYAIANGVSSRMLSPEDRAAGAAILSYSSAPLCFTPSGFKQMDGASCTLPVSLLQFSGSRKSSTANHLQWKSAQEVNNKGFEVQRSMDGKSFSSIGFVPAAGTTASALYSFNDESTGDQNWFYRLKQLDGNGKHRLSVTIQVRAGEGAPKVWIDESRQVVISSNGASSSGYTFRLFSSDGKQVLQKGVTGTIVRLALPSSAWGVYHYQLQEGEKVFSGKLFLPNP